MTPTPTPPDALVNHLDPALVEPALFWFWNDTPTPQLIDRQLDAFVDKGIRAVYIHPMPQSFREADFYGGMTVEYLSAEFFDLVAHACESMRRRDMILWLYDEGGWPSGMAGGAVVAENPSYGIWVLDREGDAVVPRQLLDQIAYPDLMNPAATDCFIRHTHEKYRLRIGSEFGKTVRGIFTDEPRLNGRVGTQRVPWSPMLPKRFLDRDVVVRLFDGAPDDELTRQIRRDYLARISTLIAENYYGRIRAWCDNNRLLFEGHHSGEDDFARHGQYFGDYLQQARNYHIPGIDTIWRQIFPGQPGGNYVGLASSVSWSRGNRIAASESFAVYGSGVTLEQMKWISAFQLVRGVNKIGAMPSLLSTRGARRISLGTNFSPRTPIWRDIDLWYDFVRRTALFTTRGMPKPRVGIFYRSELVPKHRAAEFNRIHERICDRVHDAMAGLMFVGGDDLAAAEPCAGGCRIGGVTLAALVVHVDAPLSPDEEQCITRIASFGVRVMHNASEADMASLRELSPFHFDGDAKGIRLLPLAEDEWNGFLLFNENAHEVTLSLQSHGEFFLDEWVLDSGMPAWARISMHNDEGIHISLLPGECRAFQTVRGKRSIERSYLLRESIEVNGPWSVAQEEMFVIDDDIEITKPQEAFRECELGDYSAGTPDFSGSLIYHARLTIPQGPPGCRLLLDLGVVFYSAEVWMNDRSVGRRAWAPYWFDITEQVRHGANDLRIRTTNTLANQWMRSDVHLRDIRQWRNDYLDKSSHFATESLHAGLIGPVIVRIYI